MPKEPHFFDRIAEEWTRARGRDKGAPRVKGRLIGSALGVAAVLPGFAWLWGYTVDDALISARVAANLARGHGYRFNVEGPVADAVTPLGWAYVLAPFAKSGSLDALGAAKVIGAASGLLAAALVGVRVFRTGRHPLRYGTLVVLGLCAPFAAWSVSGMETGVVTLLGALALWPHPAAALAGGLAAAWRPELIAWASVLAAGSSLSESANGAGAHRQRAAGVGVALLLSLGPLIMTSAVRQVLFGSPAPLSAVAKPSDFDHGLKYALGAMAFSGPTWLLVAFKPYARLQRREIALGLASAAHFASLVAVGGDWMAFYRLVVPIVPGLVCLAVALAEHAAPWATAARLTAALSVCCLLLVVRGPDARRVGQDRRALIAQAKPVLKDCHRVAALDVGWVSAAASCPVFDLAGVTDPQVAALPGGHTSKKIPPGLLEARKVDFLVLELAPGESPRQPWNMSAFLRVVERRVARLVEWEAFEPAAVLPLRGSGPYLVLRSKNPG
ncbi:MAG TPA: hypothetical protein VGJ84_06980 [Polyangiaceae bacterium]